MYFTESNVVKVEGRVNIHLLKKCPATPSLFSNPPYKRKHHSKNRGAKALKWFLPLTDYGECSPNAASVARSRATTTDLMVMEYLKQSANRVKTTEIFPTVMHFQCGKKLE